MKHQSTLNINSLLDHDELTPEQEREVRSHLFYRISRSFMRNNEAEIELNRLKRHKKVYVRTGDLKKKRIEIYKEAMFVFIVGEGPEIKDQVVVNQIVELLNQGMNKNTRDILIDLNKGLYKINNHLNINSQTLFKVMKLMLDSNPA